MNKIDYNALRKQTLGSGLDEEAVTVNTRALIDKVLARYSGEWTVLRELLQNAADANATKVTIRFETTPSAEIPVPNATDPSSVIKHVLMHHTLRRLLVTNNGQPFADSDWSRLKRIAEGNPDETKIGAFGVGFYSVFADCEEPFISSGKEAMAFYWKGNSLFTRKLELPEGQASSDTSFVLDYRSNTAPVPGLLSLCQFLATSLTFVGLERMELLVDDWSVLSLSKKIAPSLDVAIPKNISTTTRDNIFQVAKIDQQSVQMDAKYMSIVGWSPSESSALSSFVSAFGGGDKSTGLTSGPSLRNFFSRLTAGPSDVRTEKPNRVRLEQPPQQSTEDLLAVGSSTVFLRISTAYLRTSVSRSFAQELERATKKPPPSQTKLAILTSSFDERAASIAVEQSSGSSVNIFATVLPVKAGKVFIGFPTHQTTGILAHVSAHSVIPTVERESIDLNARWVRTWNVEMLRAAGIACRVSWSTEMNDLASKLNRMIRQAGRGKATPEDITTLLPEAIHIFKQFTFHDSTPSSEVAQLIEESFWTCSKNTSIEVLSSRGVLPSHEVRFASEDLSFVEGVPVLPDEMIEGAKKFVQKLRDFGLVSEVTISDIKNSLQSHALDEKQTTDFLKWIGRKALSQDLDRMGVMTLLKAAIAQDPDSGVLSLGSITNFLTPTRIPAELPVPSTTIPFRHTKNLSRPELEALGWQELQIVPWLRFLIERATERPKSEQDITSSAKFACQVLPVLSKQWEALSTSSKAATVELLQGRTVIPTKLGMRKPPESYFATVKLFQDLPLVVGLNGVKEKLLIALGVRKTVELGVIFERLLANPNMAEADAKDTSKLEDNRRKWSHVDLIKYLSSVSDDIPPEDMKRLKNTPICPAEGSPKLYKVMDLYEPKESLRFLKLPLLQWPGVFRQGAPESKFLHSLGLRSYPTMLKLVDKLAEAHKLGDFSQYDGTLAYCIAEHYRNNYSSERPADFDIPFLPAEGENKLFKPSECYTNDQSALLQFPILRKNLHSHSDKFGVKANPSITECVDRLLKNPPQSHRQAQLVFRYFSGRLTEISHNQAERLSKAEIIPISLPQLTQNGYPVEKKAGVRLVAPRNCFLGDNTKYGAIFDFADFGVDANPFLLKCGSKHEPSRTEIAYMLVKDPNKFLSTYQSPEKYLELLRTLSSSLATFKKDKVLWKEMKRSRFLLACKEIGTKPEKDSSNSKKARDDRFEDLEEEEETSGIKEWSLARADQIILVDDFISYSLFKDRLLAAPQEESLELFYMAIGSPSLSEIVQEESRIGAVVEDQRSAERLQKLIFERCRLFLHDHPPDQLRHADRWLEKNLKVQSVLSVSLRRSLPAQGLSHTESRTAAVTHESRSGWVLWITTQKVDYFEVAQAIISLLLLRPKPHSTMILETLLSSDLHKLKARGYNVDRILRVKALQARIAEEQRRKQMEAEAQMIEEQERQWENDRTKSPRNSKQLNMPGTFVNDSPEQQNQSQSILSNDSDLPHRNSKKSKNSLFANFTKRLGINENNSAAQNVKGLLNGSSSSLAGNQSDALPPPYEQTPHALPDKQTRGPEVVTAPHRLHQTLLSGINASRAHDSANLYSRPATQSIKEQSNYCDERPAQDISFVAEAANGIKIFLANNLTSRSEFLVSNNRSLGDFASVLLEIAEVFALRRQSMHIFYDAAGATIAFNSQGSLFCNFRFFDQLHAKDIKTKRGEALVYWFVVLAHELAHNLVAEHSAEHSFYTENFVVQYFPKMMLTVAKHGSGATAPALQASLLD